MLKYEQSKAVIAKAEQLYFLKFNERVMSYEEFKLHQEERREDETRRRRHLPRETRTSLRLETSIDNNPSQEPVKTLRELQNKKTITETAIKNSKRKHQAGIGELNAKL